MSTEPERPESTAAPKRDLRAAVSGAILDAFFATHDGYSIDWLLADPQLQAAYHAACREAGLLGSLADWNHELLRLRKQGAVSKRGPLKKVPVSGDELEAAEAAAEIAWRLAHDKYGGPSLDEVLCDPAKATYFDRAASRFGADFAPSLCRWAALRLRKASRDLVRDVKQFHFVFATRDFGRFVRWDRCRFDRFAGQQGVYLLRGESKQPLYVGKTDDLALRLAQHAACRAVSRATTHVATLTGEELPGAEYLAALKEDLVRRHQPKWNVNLVGLESTSG